MTARSRYTTEELRFIAARVIAHVKANPSALPLLGDACAGCGGSDRGERTNGRRYCRACIRKPKKGKPCTAA